MESDCHHSASALQLMWNQSATGPEIPSVGLMLTHIQKLVLYHLIGSQEGVGRILRKRHR